MDIAGSVVFWVICVALCTAPAIALPAAGQAGWRWPVIGAGSWALALQVKLLLGPVLAPWLQQLGAAPHASAWGMVSAGAELGLAAVFMAGYVRRWQDAFAFGAGVGGFEVLFVLGQANWSPRSIDAGAFPTLFLVERALTLIGHVGSRLIVFAALERRSARRMLVALVLFAVVDGAATYGTELGWDWSDKGVHGGFLAALAGWTILEVAVAWWFVRECGDRC